VSDAPLHGSRFDGSSFDFDYDVIVVGAGYGGFDAAKHAAEHGLKVALSGLGGDELFGGYPSFRMVPKLRRWRRLIGPAARHQRGAALLLGPLLQPIENPAEQLRFPKARGLAHYQLSGQGGRAGAHRSHSGMAPRIA
jgi:asparagine synthetase B (glutamine-hydrolysing)